MSRNKKTVHEGIQPGKAAIAQGGKKPRKAKEKPEQKSKMARDAELVTKLFNRGMPTAVLFKKLHRQTERYNSAAAVS